MSLKDRLYWFFYNLKRYILLIIVSPFYWLWKFIVGILWATYILFFITDGSEELTYPNEWYWL